MAAVVEVCFGELAKLKEKVVRPRKLLFFQSQEAEVAEEQLQVEATVLTCTRKPTKAKNQETTLSETTICLLMDRFTPC